MVIDRIEGEIAVLENGGDHIEVPRKELPYGAKEGDVVEERNGIYIIDTDTAEYFKIKLKERELRLIGKE